MSVWGSENRNSVIDMNVTYCALRLVEPGRGVVLHLCSKGAPVSLYREKYPINAREWFGKINLSSLNKQKSKGRMI